MSASTRLRMPRLSLTPRTVLLSATDACLAASAWTLPAADPSRAAAAAVASEAVVEVVAVAAVVASVDVVVVAVEVAVAVVAVAVVVVVASAPVRTAPLPATLAPRSRSTKRGLMHTTADRVGIWRVYH